MDLKERILEAYFGFMAFLFYIFLFCTLSFGRAFSVLYINTPFTPLFVTEIFLLLNIPFLLLKYKSLARLPGLFLVTLSVFFAYTFCHLCAGLLKQNMFALRDIVLCAYILFLPIVFIHLNSLNRFKALIVVVIFSNVINLCIGALLLARVYSSETIFNFTSKIKSFNLGLYYAIASSFIFSFYESIKPRIYRLFILIGLSVNILMLFLFAKSSIWIATILLFVFFSLMLKRKFLRLLFSSIPVFVITLIVMLSLCYKINPSVYKEIISTLFSELKANEMFMSKMSKTPFNLVDMRPQGKTATEITKVTEAEMNSINMQWRLSIWKQTLEFSRNSPLVGKGFGEYPVYEIESTNQYPEGIYVDSKMVPAHNHLLTVFFKMGILGLALFLFINGYVFAYALSYVNKCNSIFVNKLLIALLGAFVFWHTLALFFDIIDSPPTSIFLWIIIGLIFSAIEIDKSVRKSSV